MQNVILTDSISEELEDLQKGIEDVTQESWIIKSQISNWGRTSIWKKIKRLLIYFYVPLKIFFNRKKYKKIVGWQQFYALIYCFYCRLFHVKKVNSVYILNFTYKKKKGLIGKIYYRFMRYIVKSKYVDLIYVLSYNYIDECVRKFEVDKSRFKTLPFGISDLYEKYKKTTIKKDFVLSIGRSNRDYDWLIKQWGNIDYPLYIISDTYKPSIEIPKNVTLINNISGEKQYPYIMNCKALVLPIDIGSICSGDTVLLTAMSFRKNVIVTSKSTLAEMYITDKKDGFVVDKNSNELKRIIEKIITKEIDLGDKARNKFIENYSRYQMGKNIGQTIKEK